MRRGLLLALGLGAVLSLVRRAPVIPPTPPASPPAPPAAPAATSPEPAGSRGTIDLLKTTAIRANKVKVTDVAATLAYYTFLAIPALLLVAVGVFGVSAEQTTIEDLLVRLEGVVPDEALTLIGDALTRVTQSSGTGAGIAVVGLLLALWTCSGAIAALMRGLNRVHGRTETRSFARQRATALALLAWCLLAIVVSVGLLVLGGPLSAALGDALDAETLVTTLWWGAQWPILAGALFMAVGGILRAGPDGPARGRSAQIAGTSVAVAVWIGASALFGAYVSRFGDYGAAWGSLSAVIVLLTWLWLTSLALLLGAQVEAEVERRERGGP